MTVMLKTFTYILGIIAIAAGGWYWYTHPQAPAPTLVADVYPLYPGATWGNVQSKSVSEGEGYEILSTLFSNITDISGTAIPFITYYEDKLTAAGWVHDLSREAGGPGAEVLVYTKDNEFVIVSYHSVFHNEHPDAPSECPCDLQFSLMSGTSAPLSGPPESAYQYHDATLGFAVRLPTVIASSSSESSYGADTSYSYTGGGASHAIKGVKFTIPSNRAAGTNLSADTYLSVEHLPEGQACDAAAFMADPSVKSRIVKEGVVSYSVASSSDAGAGNRYEETVYARLDSSPCIAVRYFVHYAAIGNFEPGTVTEFNKAALIAEFDQIRRTLALSGH